MEFAKKRMGNRYKTGKVVLLTLVLSPSEVIDLYPILRGYKPRSSRDRSITCSLQKRVFDEILDLTAEVFLS